MSGFTYSTLPDALLAFVAKKMQRALVTLSTLELYSSLSFPLDSLPRCKSQRKLSISLYPLFLKNLSAPLQFLIPLCCRSDRQHTHTHTCLHVNNTIHYISLSLKYFIYSQKTVFFKYRKKDPALLYVRIISNDTLEVEIKKNNKLHSPSCSYVELQWLLFIHTYIYAYKAMHLQPASHRAQQLFSRTPVSAQLSVSTSTSHLHLPAPGFIYSLYHKHVRQGQNLAETHQTSSLHFIPTYTCAFDWKSLLNGHF